MGLYVVPLYWRDISVAFITLFLVILAVLVYTTKPVYNAKNLSLGIIT